MELLVTTLHVKKDKRSQTVHKTYTNNIFLFQHGLNKQVRFKYF